MSLLKSIYKFKTVDWVFARKRRSFCLFNQCGSTFSFVWRCQNTASHLLRVHSVKLPLWLQGWFRSININIWSLLRLLGMCWPIYQTLAWSLSTCHLNIVVEVVSIYLLIPLSLQSLHHIFVVFDSTHFSEWRFWGWVLSHSILNNGNWGRRV